MNTNEIIQKLKNERRKIDAAISSLEALNGALNGIVEPKVVKTVVRRKKHFKRKIYDGTTLRKQVESVFKNAPHSQFHAADVRKAIIKNGYRWKVTSVHAELPKFAKRGIIKRISEGLYQLA